MIVAGPRIPRIALLLALAPCGACTGTITDGLEGPPADDRAANPTGSGGSGPPAADDACAPSHLPVRIRMLSNRQYGNAARDLVGLAAAPAVVGGGVSKDAFFTAAAARVSAPLVFSYAEVAWRAAADLGLGGRIDKLVGCAPSASEPACVRSFIHTFGARAFRRPLHPEEESDLFQVYAVGREDGFATGIELVVETLLDAPSFIYRTELGDGAAGEVPLTPHELASQLSFLFLDSIPDPPLWQAAQDGSLGTTAEIAAQVERLLRLPVVRQNLEGILLGWLGISRVDGATKDPKLFPDFAPASYARETALFVHDLLWSRGGKLGDLVTSNRSFADAALARVYGVARPGAKSDDELVPVTLPRAQRSGVLTHGSLMAALSHVGETSVVYRGRFVREDLLCLPGVPAPPMDGSIQAALAAAPRQETERARSEFRLKTAPCSGCHGLIDPLGLLFENYDPVGRYRVQTAKGPIDASVDLAVSPALSGHVDGAVAFGQKVAVSPELASCASRQVMSYAVGSDIKEPAACAVRQVERDLVARGSSLVDLFRLVAVSPALRTRERQGGAP